MRRRQAQLPVIDLGQMGEHLRRRGAVLRNEAGQTAQEIGV